MAGPTHDPWLRYRDTSLYAVPSVHYRQVFAQLVFECCYRRKFDVIAVELPPSYQDVGIVDAALRLAPAPGMVIHPTGGKVELMQVPVSDDPRCVETELRPVKQGVLYPLTPADSITTALRCPQLLRDRWQDWKPEVALIDAEYRVGERPQVSINYRDDYEVMVDGLAAFISRLDAQWQPARCPIVDDHRDRVMGSRLRRFLDAGKEVLFVCGAAHWKSICEYLDSGVRETLEPFRAPQLSRLILAPMKPEIAWLWGWLDDIPRVLWELELCGQRGKVSDFDKRQAVQTIVGETFDQAREQKIPVSIRRMLTMSRFADTLTSIAGRWVPELDEQLIPAAEACGEERFAELLKKRALEFPAPLPPGSEMATVLPYGDGKWFVKVEDEVFLVEFPKAEGKRTRRVAIKVPQPLTEQEKERLNTEPSSGRDWPAEQQLFYLMDARARDLAQRKERTTFSRKFTGSMADGPDWRRTIRARAAGEQALYIRQARPHIGRQDSQSPIMTPVVWIFDDCAEIIDHDSYNAWLADGDLGITALLYVCEVGRLAEGRIRAQKLAAITDLGHSRAYCGRHRPSVLDGMQERDVDTAYLMSLPEAKRCSQTVWSDRELLRFSGTDHAIAAGIKFAHDKIILISRSSLPVSAAVQGYAERKRVKISRLSIDNFEPKRMERFRRYHWVECPGYDGYDTPYEWCSRFVPPI